mmetsp:Transcript_5009/g.14043  ORF Transcript_5009/g.14043 Transcript_5009/m.14043 type:complete len:469 (+) Transcript_5009:147-1553(+)|eukprot:CAMPEP_0119143814 /NCGR_PEP_ID=MMETSP1310-20130426/34886_1 /TAXON_ID=464262 /ORGANISM="Genus nov. species nov., Strain RCC2339" /LENGTH=468 /DNA_ID=CAMNT_0007135477 /DNA_START=63 /DNA_END=1469 /DNA_ORIENTATION=-
MADGRAPPHMRAARKQPGAPDRAVLQSLQGPKDGSTYNAWYGKYTGDGEGELQKRLREERYERMPTLEPERDVGLTKANILDSGRSKFLCLHFARGECANGKDCTYLHRLPTDEDDRHIGALKDVFGREKHRDDRDDMGGVGSFERTSKTLYVGGITNTRGKTQFNLEKYFGRFGKVEYIRIIHSKNIAFVRFRNRVYAEFAKEAAHDRPFLVEGEAKEILNVRWAHDDPNPKAKKYEDTVKQDMYNAAMYRYWASMGAAGQNYYNYQNTPGPQVGQAAGAYPTTDAQYAMGAGQGGYAAPPATGLTANTAEGQLEGGTNSAVAVPGGDAAPQPAATANQHDPSVPRVDTDSQGYDYYSYGANYLHPYADPRGRYYANSGSGVVTQQTPAQYIQQTKAERAAMAAYASQHGGLPLPPGVHVPGVTPTAPATASRPARSSMARPTKRRKKEESPESVNPLGALAAYGDE